MLNDDQVARFRADLLRWYSVNERELPWRQTCDPYKIWISEIMLQQTRVAAVIPYYERFLQKFPNLRALASAPEAEVLACWAGLGYYYRARNLHKAAQQMQEAGAFPATHSQICQLPGVGEYTAAAIASIGFKLPHAVVDGNVNRVLTRLLADPVNVRSASGKKYLARVADKLLDRTEPGAFNQAVMELGATICLPKRPHCLVCPVSAFCLARKTGQQEGFPVKTPRPKIMDESRTLFWIERDGHLLLWQRPPGLRLMPGFWELPERAHIPDVYGGAKIGSFRHGITFHSYRFELWRGLPPNDCGACEWVRLDELAELPLSTVLKKAKRLVDQTRTKNIRAGASSRAVTDSGRANAKHPPVKLDSY